MIMTARPKAHASRCVQWTGDNKCEIIEFLAETGIDFDFWRTTVGTEGGSKEIGIVTMNPRTYGRVDADEGDYILLNDSGEVSTCRPEVFRRDFEIENEEGCDGDLG